MAPTKVADGARQTCAPRARRLDALPLSSIRFGEHWLPTYLLSGGTGVAIGSLIFAALAVLRQEHALLAFAMIGLLVGCFVVFGLIRRVLTGSETHVLLEHWLFATAMASLALKLAGLPVLPWLDLLTIAYCIVFAFGRVGCTLNGCCHGVPASIGLRYGNVRRFPVQPVECVLWLCLAAAAAVMTWHSPKGTAFGFTCVVYGVMRPILERFRADPRPHAGPFSESDLLSLLLLAIGVGVFLNLRPLHTNEVPFVALGLTSGLLALITYRRWLTLERIATPPESHVEPVPGARSSEGPSTEPTVDAETIFAEIRRAMLTDALTSVPRVFADRGISLAASKISGSDDVAALLVSLPRTGIDLGRAETIFRALATYCGIPRNEALTTVIQAQSVACAMPWQRSFVD